MNKLYTLFVSLFVFGAASAQFTMNYASHGIATGDAHDYYLAKPVEAGPSGLNQVWDFSSLVRLDENADLTSNMLAPMVLKSGTTIGQANAVIEEYGNKFFFQVGEDGIKQYGLETKAGNLVVKYTEPFVKMKYPFTFSDKISGAFSGEMITGTTTRAFNGEYEVAADGYGKLILPNNVEVDNVLRVKTTRKNIYTNSFVSTVTYRWYLEDVRYPVLVVIKQETPNSSKVIKTAYHPNVKTALSADELNRDMKEGFVVYPNPFINYFNLKYKVETTASVSVELFDMSGKKVGDLIESKMQVPGLYEVPVNISSFAVEKGTYFVKMKIGNNDFTKTVIGID